MRNPPMNIVFTANTSYAEHLAVAMCSLFESNQDLAFDVYIVNAEIEEVSWRSLEEIAKRYGHRLIDTKISDQELKELTTSHHFKKESYYRLFIAEKLQAPRALFLDADIVVNGSIDELYATDIENYYLAAVADPGISPHKDLEMAGDAKYFNAGVMLLNLERCRQEHLREKVVGLVNDKPWAVPFLEQCGLNSIINGRWKPLHPKYNLQGWMSGSNIETYSAFFPDGELVAAVRSPVIIHYSGAGKPWQFGYKHPHRKLYWKYLRMTSFNHRFSSDLSISKLIGHYAPQSLKDFVKAAIQRAHS